MTKHIPPYRILVSDKLSEQGLDVLRREAALSVDVKTGLSAAELRDIIGDYDALVIRGGTDVTADVINRAGCMKVIGRAGIGVDNVDIAAATKAGIVVMNTPGGNTITTAEHTMAMIMSLARRIPAAVASVKGGKWEKSKFMGTELFGKTLGLVGLGRIGSVVAERARAFAMKVVAFDPYISSARAADMGVELAPLASLIERADVITLHVPRTEATKGILGSEQFSRMKKGVLIVNCARGGLVDEAALLDALNDGRVAGAALDVLEDEPPSTVTDLIAHQNVIVTPHLGASTREAQENVAVAVAEQVRDFLLRGIICNAVNVPCVPFEVLEKIRPLVLLAEIIGSFLSQIATGAVREVLVNCSGDLVAANLQAVAIAALKGVLEWAVKDVNTVNAPVIAQARGIRVSESVLPAGDYKNFIQVELRTEQETRTMGGTVLRRQDARIVSLDGFFLEASPTAAMLVIINRDEPGVIGRIGTILGDHKINIADMHLGCKLKHGTAASIFNIDEPLSAAVMDQIKALPFIINAVLVRLPESLVSPVSIHLRDAGE